MNNVLTYVTDNAIILVPVLYILGMIFKGTEKIPDKYIPLLLLPIGIIFCIFIMGLSVNSIIQGILVTGCSVYFNQLIKQQHKDK